MNWLFQKVTLLRGKKRCKKGERATSALIMCFVEPHNQPISILGRFHRLDDDVRAIYLEKGEACSVRCGYARSGCRLFLASHAHDWDIELVGTPHTVRLPPIACMWQEAIGEAMHAFIGMSIRRDAGFEERQTHDVIVDVMAVLAIIEQADPISPFTYIHPAMSTDLKTGQVPGGVAVGGTLHRAKLDFIGGPCAVDGQREGCFQ